LYSRSGADCQGAAEQARLYISRLSRRSRTTSLLLCERLLRALDPPFPRRRAAFLTRSLRDTAPRLDPRPARRPCSTADTRGFRRERIAAAAGLAGAGLSLPMAGLAGAPAGDPVPAADRHPARPRAGPARPRCAVRRVA